MPGAEDDAGERVVRERHGDLRLGLEPPFLDLHAAEWLPGGAYRIRPAAWSLLVPAAR